MPTCPLLIVHADSCLGSADFNLGRYEARALRDYLGHFLDHRPPSPVAVLDGGFADELVRTTLGRSIDQALARAAEAGFPAFRMRAADEDEVDQVAAIPSVVAALSLATGGHIEVTGAWIDSDNPSSGCVTSVHRRLRELGFVSRIHDSAFDIAGEEAA